MKQKIKLLFFTVAFIFSYQNLAFSSIDQTKLELFQRLSSIGIDQVVELPYNRSLVSQLGRQAKVYNIDVLQDQPNLFPEAQSLLDVFTESIGYNNPNFGPVPSLSFRTGRSDCSYAEAVKVSNTLVCYRNARENSSMLAPVSHYGPRCTTANATLTHCYIFAHQVDEVVRAIETSDR